jgi:acyl-coenzyme A synthetase/AMP-(fatty) acid ligase
MIASKKNNSYIILAKYWCLSADKQQDMCNFSGQMFAMENYRRSYTESIENPTVFWGEEAKKLNWFKQPTTIFEPKANGTFSWFPDGELNTSYLCLDHHVANGLGNQTAMIFDSPVTNTIQKYSYSELLALVAKFAGALRAKGLEKGDRVIIYMPMVPEATIAMLACARLGLIHSVVFGGFAAHELAIRIDDAGAKAIITANFGIEIQRIIPYHPIIEQALSLATNQPELVISYNRANDTVPINTAFADFHTLLQQAAPVAAVSLKATDPLYILYTSGTTGKPKGIVRDNGGHAVALRFSMEKIYGIKQGEVFWAASDIGWVVGHSYIVYAPLIAGATTIVFEGKPIKTPNAGTFWRIIHEHNVAVFFTAPTAIRAIRKEDPHNEFYNPEYTKNLRSLFLAGERCDIATLEYAQTLLQKPVIDHWWQTESGWPMIANMQGFEAAPVKPGSSSFPVCGYNIQILKEDGSVASALEQGFVTIKLPLPPGCLPTLWQNNERFEAGYLSQYPGYYFTGDGGYVDEEGYIFITGRVDDVINVAGHRLSTAEMEEITAGLACTAECAVIGANDELKGEVPIAFVVLKDTETRDFETISSEIKAKIRSEIGAVASLKTVYFVQRLPKTRSGKILRTILRSLANNAPFTIPGTIEDAAVIDELKEVLRNS